MTSVEWLINQLEDNGIDHLDLAYEIIEQAKEIHKQEIIQAHNDGFEKSGEGWNGEYGLEDMNNISEEIKSEQYYQETFKK